MAKEQKHSFEKCPPQQKRFPDSYAEGMAGTALPLTDAKVSSDPRDKIAANLDAANYMNPTYNSDQSVYIHQSHTNGKRG